MIVNSYSDINKDDSTLRPYQQKAKKEIFESWDEVDNVMFQMPTGTGKTRLFTSIIRDINEYSKQRREPVKILIIAHRTELIDQIDESLTKYRVPHNVIAGGRDRDYKYPVNVASIQTITHPSNLKEAKKLNVQFVIIDEAHHALATTYKKLWSLYPGSKKLGVTATPWRMNHQSFLDLFDKLVLSMPIKDFIKQGYLAPYKYFSLRSNSDIQRTIDDIELDDDSLVTYYQCKDCHCIVDASFRICRPHTPDGAPDALESRYAFPFLPVCQPSLYLLLAYFQVEESVDPYSGLCIGLGSTPSIII